MQEFTYDTICSKRLLARFWASLQEAVIGALLDLAEELDEDPEPNG
ncbi:MAG: hypothetical protein ACUVS3_11835 [Thermodesulfobacteriota bacterium]